MRKMLLSFKPDVYNKIYTGIKIFEHRRNFPDEPIMAYMYVSKPVRAITGIVILNNRHRLIDWENEFNNDKIVLLTNALFFHHGVDFGFLHLDFSL